VAPSRFEASTSRAGSRALPLDVADLSTAILFHIRTSRVSELRLQKRNESRCTRHGNWDKEFMGKLKFADECWVCCLCWDGDPTEDNSGRRGEKCKTKNVSLHKNETLEWKRNKILFFSSVLCVLVLPLMFFVWVPCFAFAVSLPHAHTQCRALSKGRVCTNARFPTLETQEHKYWPYGIVSVRLSASDYRWVGFMKFGTSHSYTLGAIEYFWFCSFIIFLALIFWFLGGIIYF
jgi:hypothetical protein